MAILLSACRACRWVAIGSGNKIPQPNGCWTRGKSLLKFPGILLKHNDWMRTSLEKLSGDPEMIQISGERSRDWILRSAE